MCRVLLKTIYVLQYHHQLIMTPNQRRRRGAGVHLRRSTQPLRADGCAMENRERNAMHSFHRAHSFTHHHQASAGIMNMRPFSGVAHPCTHSDSLDLTFAQGVRYGRVTRGPGRRRDWVRHRVLGERAGVESRRCKLLSFAMSGRVMGSDVFMGRGRGVRCHKTVPIEAGLQLQPTHGGRFSSNAF
ncbi:hypothetical protein IE81DRAFT_73758 [Ceraceosorus guamensis]|uniref:Uncharacterized protein n=1 Tax=Ceraceosorus guamensis TaxID=1522189 RepID=A0A316VMF8_9BASI|nr:hypothetical protein IE81DRAFT_73758 [Ceraceosorus guamensis]PWN38819.1 hypothetical protein IE81DRAFT_73758 [Ceraceosorus guamensis]